MTDSELGGLAFWSAFFCEVLVARWKVSRTFDANLEPMKLPRFKKYPLSLKKLRTRAYFIELMVIDNFYDDSHVNDNRFVPFKATIAY